MEGTRAPGPNFSPVIGDYFSRWAGGGKFSNYTNWLPLILLSCRFKTETEALEGFSAIALQATAVAPVTRVSQLSTLCRHLKKKKKTLSVYIIQA